MNHVRAFFINHSAAADHLGGSELSLLQLVDEWIRLDPGFEPTIITPSKRGAFAAEVQRRRWRLKAVDYGGWALTEHPGGRPEAAARIHRNAQATRRIIELIREEQPSLVVTNTLVAPWGAFAANATGVPHVWFVREFADVGGAFHFPLGREQTLSDIGTLSVRVFANSSAVRESLLPYIPAEKVSVAYPIVDADRIRELAAEPLPSDPFPTDVRLKVVMVGRITRAKGQWRLVEAIGKLSQHGIRVAACFVGAAVEGQADIALRARAAKLGVDDLVNFVGEQHNPFPFVEAADVGVLASTREAFGRVTLEYLLLGRPVVATSAGGSPELVSHGRTGFLFSGSSADDLAKYLERYATDPELLRQHREAARAGGDGVVAAGISVTEVVDALQNASRESVSSTANAIVELWSLPERLRGYHPDRVGAIVRVRGFARRVIRISKDPINSFHRWRHRRIAAAAQRREHRIRSDRVTLNR